jgi:RHS repeat-associated protein
LLPAINKTNSHTIPWLQEFQKKDLIDPENSRRYYYNYKWQVLCEYNGSDEFQQWYAYGNYIDEVLAMGSGIFASTARFYIHDHLYSPVALTDYSGSVLERYEYDAYGDCYVMDASYNPRTKSSYGNPFYFTGRELDVFDNGNLKVYNYRHRYYDSYTGRFTTHDPLGITPNAQWPNGFGPIGQYKDVVNVYEYISSNPLLGTDPLGLIGFPPIGLGPASSLLKCGIFAKIADVILAGKKAMPGAPFSVLGGGNPWKHCLWSCNMTKAKGEDFAEDMGKKKEELDIAIADLTDAISDECWKKEFPGMDLLRKTLSAWACSADQGSDYEDNAAGRDCGSDPSLSVISCVQCCSWVKGINPETPEGDKKRPFGPRCKDRYKSEMEEIFGREVEVENPK